MPLDVRAADEFGDSAQNNDVRLTIRDCRIHISFPLSVFASRSQVYKPMVLWRPPGMLVYPERSRLNAIAGNVKCQLLTNWPTIARVTRQVHRRG